MRRKFFIGSKAVRIATGIFAGVLVFAGCLGVFYAANQTLTYSRNLKSNENWAKQQGAFWTEEEYRSAAKTQERVDKRLRAENAYDLARSLNLIGKSEVSESEIATFVASLDLPQKPDFSAKSIPDLDKRMMKLSALFSVILDRTDDLVNADPQQFATKMDIFTHLASVGVAMDGHGTFTGNICRANVSEKILRRVYAFQKNPRASSEMKDQLIASCVPIFRAPYDLPFMFRFEHLRIQKMIDVSNGKGSIAATSDIYQKPTPLTAIQRFKLRLPGVASAWESRFHEAMSYAIAKCEPDPEIIHLTASITLTMTEYDLLQNRLNTEYLDHFGLLKTVSTPEFMNGDWLIRHIDEKQKSDQSQKLPPSKLSKRS